MKNPIFTIGRTCGSGGHEIGALLAKTLDIPFYDKELISIAAQESGVSSDVFENLDEEATNSFLYSLSMGAFTYGNAAAGFTSLSMNDKLFLAQSKVIREAAEKGPFVVVGRCGDYVLSAFPNTVNVFLYADKEDCIDHISTGHGISRSKAADYINKKNKKTASYYSYYANQKWGSSEHYDLMINTSRMSREDVVALILEYAQKTGLKTVEEN